MGRPPSALPNRRETAVGKSPVGRAGAPAVLAAVASGPRALHSPPDSAGAASGVAGNGQGYHCTSTDRAIPRLVDPDTLRYRHISAAMRKHLRFRSAVCFAQFLSGHPLAGSV